jgi:hypothetical protein
MVNTARLEEREKLRVVGREGGIEKDEEFLDLITWSQYHVRATPRPCD